MRRIGTHIIFGFLLLAATSAAAQSIVVQPPTLLANGKSFPTVLYQPQEILSVGWDRSIPDLRLKIGNVPGEFRSVSLDAGDRTEVSFSPGEVGLPVGVYYAILTNATADRFADIRTEARASDIHYSAMFTFAVESPIAPRIIRPRGIVDSSTPTFEWEAVPGAQAYALVVSSTPFDIRTDPITNDSVVEGINIVWALITTETTAVYAQSDLGSPFPQFPAPPLIPDQEYNYTVLNGYSKTDPAFLSDVFGSVVAFTYESDTGLDAPTLSAPGPDVSLFGDTTIRFEWEPVDDATSYSFSLFERRKEDGSVGDFQVFSTTTPATAIDVSARTLLRRGIYSWYVIPSDASGAGSVSERRSFFYSVPMGTFTFITRSVVDDAGLIGVRIGIRSLEGGYSPVNPFINNTSVSFSDSLVTGTYAFDATKEGYADTTVVATILTDQWTVVQIPLRPLPSSVTGVVQEPDGRPVENAVVTMDSGTQQREAITGADGHFTRAISPGTYTVTARRDGYTASAERVITVGSEDFFTLATPLVIERSGGQVSGRVLSESGQPIQLATVRATLNGTVQEVTTNGSGAFSLFLATGTWSLQARKDGFVSPAATTLTISRGDNIQQVNLVLTERAGRISGTVFGTTVSDQVSERGAVPGAIVEAVPHSGNVIGAVADGAGLFTLDLGAGAWRVRARSDGFLESDPLDVVLGLGDTVDGAVFDLRTPSASVSGTVRTPAGEPVSSARVRLGGFAEAVTTADGAYRIDAGPGEYVLRVFALDYAMESPRLIRLAAGNELRGIDLVLVPGAARLTGRVRASGTSVPRAWVRAEGTGATVDWQADDRGEYALSLTPGTWQVTAEAPGHLRSDVSTITLLAGQTKSGLDLDLVRSTSFIQGYVTAAAGPVRGARIVASRQDGSGTALVGLSRGDGGFSLAVAPGTAYSVRISAEGYIPQTVETAVLASGVTSFLDTSLRVRTAGISGHILDATGRPLAGASVRATRSGSDPVESISAFDGRFELAMPPGAWLINASLPGYAQQQRDINLAIGQFLDGFDFGLSSQFGFVLVNVVDAATAPVSGALVVLTGVSDARTVSTGPDGAASFPGLAAGSYVLTASAADFDTPVPLEIEVAAETSQSLTVRVEERVGAVTARIHDTIGNPVVGAVLRISASNEEVFTSVSAADGLVERRRLPLGAIEWTVFHPAHGSLGPVAVELTTAVPELDLGNVVLAERSSGVAGFVFDGSGNAVQGAVIQVSGDQGAAGAESAADGAYRITGLVAGVYTVEAKKAGHIRKVVQLTLVPGETASADLVLGTADGRLTGSVLDPAGNPLPFAVRVTANTGTVVHATGTDASGFYVLEGLESGREYALRTDISQIGYGNAEKSVDFPSGQVAVGPIVLTVSVQTAEITGSAGTDKASVRIIAPGGGSIQQVVQSGSDGRYRARYLPPGTWIVAPEKEGFSFAPATLTVTLAIAAQLTADFAASSSVGSIRAVVQNDINQPLPGVAVSLTSEDGLVARNAGTGADGGVLFDGLPLGRVYVVRPIAPGFSSRPVVASVSLTDPALQAVTFTLVEANGRISGRVIDALGVAVSDARVTAVHTETGSVFHAEAADGTYQMTLLPAGTFSISASADGFRGDPVIVVLAEGQAASAPDLVVFPVTVRIHGRVLYRNGGLAGVRVSATAGSALETRTDVTGAFRFPRAPVIGEPADTTVYLVQAETSAGPRSHVVRITGAEIGSVVTVPDFLVPSGRITVRVTDRVEPLAGASVDLASSEGISLGGETDTGGVFRTAETLAAGSYSLAVSRSGYLTPSLDDSQVQLATDTSAVARTVAMPYRHTPPEAVATGATIPITVAIREGYLPPVAQATVFWRRSASEPYQSQSLDRQDSAFAGGIPAVSTTDPVLYFVSVVDGHVPYVSETVTLHPKQPGRLTLARIEPALDGTLIRTAESYALTLQLRDGLGTSLRDRFVGTAPAGRIAWSASRADVELSVDPVDPTRVRLRVPAVGAFDLRVNAVLDGVSIESVARVTVSDAAPSAIVISVPSARVDNRSTGIQLSHQAVTPDGLPQLLGDELSWSITPAGAGSIDASGFFTPTNTQFIGPVVLTARDRRSGKTGSLRLTLFARVEGAMTLTDLAGTVIELPEGAFPVAADVSLGQPVLAGPKRSVIPSGEASRFTVGDRLIRFSVRSDRAQLGDSLAVPALLSRESDPSLALHEGEHALGLFDASTLRWTLLATESSGSLLLTTVRQLSEFGELVQNEALGLRHAVVLPSPFSPEIAPLKIGYFLATDDPPAIVSVRVFNVRGERIRTLLDRETQFPGRFGSRTSAREITWDGLTDAGTRARNGRYLIEIKATDQTGTVRELLQVVLVK